MKKNRQLIQGIMDKKAQELLDYPISELNDLPDYGSFDSELGNNSIGYWVWEKPDHSKHVVLQHDERAFLFLHNKYLAGICYTDSSTRLLSQEEIGDYD